MKNHTVTSSRILAQSIYDAQGKFITVQFITKDGQLRTLNGRLGVKKHIKGIGAPVDPTKFITVYDVKKMGYRCVNMDTIVGLRSRGVEFAVVR